MLVVGVTAPLVTIVHHFLDMLCDPETGEQHIDGNWGTSYDTSHWNVDADTYINGIMVTVDCDYHMGYVIEIVDRGEPGYVNWLAIAVYHGRNMDDLSWDHDWAHYPCAAQPFFDRTVGHQDVAEWGVRFVYSAIGGYEEALRRA
jgi:hypothetical protein